MRKTIVSLLLSAAMCAALLSGCGSSSNEVQGETNQTVDSANTENVAAGSTVKNLDGTSVVVGIADDPASLAPWVANNGGRIGILPSIYQTLIQTESLGSEMTGVLMESWEQVDDVTYKMKIYDYIYDTAGNHLTAADVAFSYNTAKEQGNLNKLNEVKSVTAIDDYNIEFVFGQKLMAGQLETLWSEAFVVTQAAYEASDDGMAVDPVGTCNYEVTQYVPGATVTLSKTDKYWQTNEALTMQMYKANVDNIEFDIITDANQMATALKTGAIDMTNTVDSVDLPSFQEGGEYADNFTAFQIMANNTYMLQFNCDESAPTGNENLRMAIAYGIDVDQIIKTVFGGNAFKVHGYGNEKYGDYNKAWDKESYFDFDLEKAQEYLAAFEKETGIKASDLNLRLIVKEAARANDQDVMQIIQGYLLALGINSEIINQSVNNYVSFMSEPSAWEITMSSENAASSNYLIVWWENQMNPSYFNWGGTFGFVFDDKLTELINAAKTPEGHTTENMDTLQSYMNEHIYNYGMVGFYENVVAANWVTSVYTEFRIQILPGGCEYNWDAKK